ncbi:hypothetical protein ALC60_13501 [Trachymyrmex zeteki]|uniref:HAT C-terminal dimerisation domain-containing protein n=1 Tax=Mycetomoellerius zeteki TaxID=64791 RepID=A0A151WI09_9HYME|nr:hypothetical protein ALC60_13501 [Trachymyrmex zeteki]
MPHLKEEIKKIIKYFRNTHFPAAKYKQAGGTALNLPIDVRWNSLADCYESYLKNWHILAKVCSENITVFDVEICTKVQNLDLKTNVQNHLIKLQQICITLDKVQSEVCTIGEATEIWLNLLQSTKKIFNEFEIQCFKHRFDMAITPYHYLANLLDHRFRGQKLNQDQIEETLEYASSRYPEAMPFIIQYQARSSPFREYLFSTENIKNVSPISWWRSLQNSMNNVMFDLSMQVHTAVASSAGIERLFSTFGFIHSKVRNRLGIEKASKLVSIMKSLNSKNSE